MAVALPGRVCRHASTSLISEKVSVHAGASGAYFSPLMLFGWGRWRLPGLIHTYLSVKQREREAVDRLADSKGIILSVWRVGVGVEVVYLSQLKTQQQIPMERKGEDLPALFGAFIGMAN